jgi:hypothetical protein
MPNANWSNPQLTSTYTNFVSEVKNRDEDLALQFDGTTSTNLLTNTIRWDSSANRWKKWNSTSWAELASTYALTALSTTGSATIGTTLGVTGAITGSSTVTGTALIPSGSSIPVNGVYLPSANSVAIATNSAQRLAIDSSGNISIPGALSTTGTNTAASFIPTSSSAPTNGVYLPAANSVAISTNSSQRLVVDASGRVGVGRTPVAYGSYNVLDLAGSAGSIQKWVHTGSTVELQAYASATLTAIGSATNHPFIITTNDTERLRITAAGLVGVGTSAPDAQVEILRTSTTDPSLRLRYSSTSYYGDHLMSPNGDYVVYAPAANGVTSGNLKLRAGSNFSISTNNASVSSPALTIDTSQRVGIGTSAPSATLDVAGPVNINGSGGGGNSQLSFKSGGAGASGFQIGQGLNSQFLYIYDNAAGSDRIRIDSSGRVGIGTTSPTYAVDVVGAVRASSNGSGVAFAHNGDAAIRDVGSGTATYLDLAFGSASHGQLIIRSSNAATERLRIDSSGRLLVGTSTAFDSANTGTSWLVGIENPSNYTAFSIKTNQASPNGAYINLGKSRGTTANSKTLVSNNDELGGVYFEGADGSAMRVGASISAWVDGTPGSNDMPSRLVFSTTADGAASPTERMRITRGGNVLVNRTAQTAGERFAVYTDVTSSNTAYFWYGQTDDRANVICRHDRSIGGNVGVQIAFLNQTGSNVGQISSTGSATTYTTSSDYRLKENVVPLTNAINRFNQLQVHRFNFIADSETVVDGFIAHEVQSIVPEAIVGEKDAVNQDGSMKPQGIDQSKLVPLLTAALQEAIAKIKTLETKVAALEAV